MAFVPTGSRLASLGQAAGQALGGLVDPISEGLSLLSQQKINELNEASKRRNQQYEQQQYSKRVLPLLNEFNFQNPEALSNTPEPLLKEVIKGKFNKKNNISNISPGLKKIIPELSDEDADEISKLSPGLLLEFYRNYLNAPNEGAKKNYINKAVEELGTDNLFDEAPINLEEIGNGTSSPAEISGPGALAKSGKQAQINAKRETEELKRQDKQKIARNEQITKQNAPFNDSLDAQKNVLEEANKTAKEMLKLLDAGSLSQKATGLFKSATKVFRSREEANFESLADDLAGLEAQAIPGVVSKYRLQFMRGKKPNLTNPTEANRDIIKRVIQRTNEGLEKISVKNRLIRENNNEPVENLEHRTNEYISQISKSNRQSIKNSPVGKIAKVGDKFIQKTKTGIREISEEEAERLLGENQ